MNNNNNNNNSININTNVHKVEECTNHDGKRCTITCFSPDGSPLQGTYVQYLHLHFHIYIFVFLFFYFSTFLFQLFVMNFINIPYILQCEFPNTYTHSLTHFLYPSLFNLFSLSGKNFVVTSEGASLGRKPSNGIVLSLTVQVTIKMLSRNRVMKFCCR